MVEELFRGEMLGLGQGGSKNGEALFSYPKPSAGQIGLEFFAGNNVTHGGNVGVALSCCQLGSGGLGVAGRSLLWRGVTGVAAELLPTTSDAAAQAQR